MEFQVVAFCKNCIDDVIGEIPPIGINFTMPTIICEVPMEECMNRTEVLDDYNPIHVELKE